MVFGAYTDSCFSLFIHTFGDCAYWSQKLPTAIPPPRNLIYAGPEQLTEGA